MSKSKVLFIMTGSIACYKACHVISRLVQGGCDVQVVASSAALQFVGNATLEGLSGNPVVSDMYARGNVMEHIHLMRWADLILVAPATASFLNKAAQGAGDDLIQTLFLAHDFQRPFLIAPAMNKSMYGHPVTQRSLQSLKEMGLEILDSASGILACGEEGWGRLLEPDMILDLAFTALKKKPTVTPALTEGKLSTGVKTKVLVTAGGTEEAIDTVRSITNLSTGSTGTQIAEHLHHMGVEVTLLLARNSAMKPTLPNTEYFTDFKSLDEKIKLLLGSQNFTHVIHAAAVSDYSVESVESDGKTFSPNDLKKLSSDSPTLNLKLRRNHKIVDRLKQYAGSKQLKVIAFKLTSGANAEDRTAAVRKLLQNAGADFVVHNDLSEIDTAARSHRFSLHDSDAVQVCDNLEQLTHRLVEIILPKDVL